MVRVNMEDSRFTTVSGPEYKITVLGWPFSVYVDLVVPNFFTLTKVRMGHHHVILMFAPRPPR